MTLRIFKGKLVKSSYRTQTHTIFSNKQFVIIFGTTQINIFPMQSGSNVNKKEWSSKTLRKKKDDPKNYWPGKYLFTIYKLIKSLLMNSIYYFLNENNNLHMKNNGHRRGSYGYKEQLIIKKWIWKIAGKMFSISAQFKSNTVKPLIVWHSLGSLKRWKCCRISLMIANFPLEY